MSQSLFKTTREPLPQDPVKSMLSFTCGEGRGRRALHDWIIAAAPPPSLHGFVFLEHCLLIKCVFPLPCLWFQNQLFCQTTSDVRLSAWTKADSIWLVFFLFSTVQLYIIYAALLLCSTCHHFYFLKAAMMLWFNKRSHPLIICFPPRCLIFINHSTQTNSCTCIPVMCVIKWLLNPQK